MKKKNGWRSGWKKSGESNLNGGRLAVGGWRLGNSGFCGGYGVAARFLGRPGDTENHQEQSDGPLEVMVIWR